MVRRGGFRMKSLIEVEHLDIEPQVSLLWLQAARYHFCLRAFEVKYSLDVIPWMFCVWHICIRRKYN